MESYKEHHLEPDGKTGLQSSCQSMCLTRLMRKWDLELCGLRSFKRAGAVTQKGQRRGSLSEVSSMSTYIMYADSKGFCEQARLCLLCSPICSLM